MTSRLLSIARLKIPLSDGSSGLPPLTASVVAAVPDCFLLAISAAKSAAKPPLTVPDCCLPFSDVSEALEGGRGGVVVEPEPEV